MRARKVPDNGWFVRAQNHALSKTGLEAHAICHAGL